MQPAGVLSLARVATGSLLNRRSPRPTSTRLAGLQGTYRRAAGRHHAVRPLRISTAVKATAAPPAAERATPVEWERTLPLGPGLVSVHVSASPDEQRIVVATSMPGRLLLHWGVEGGKGYKGGWRLPGERCQPEGSYNYKNRALQTPFRSVTGNGLQSVGIVLSGDEASDYINFVVKNEDTGVWYDLNGTNFQLPLRNPPSTAAPTVNGNGNGNGNGKANGKGEAAAVDLPPLLPLDKIPQLPQELCGIWAYIKWEVSGCPNRSKEEADREYQAGIGELTTLLRRGRPIEELWRVARGEVKYADYMKQYSYLLAPGSNGRTMAPPPQKQQQQQKPSVYIPDDLVGVQAYLLWEEAGKPDGADFGDKAREILEGRLRSGASLADIERELRSPQPQQQQPNGNGATAAPPKEQQAAPPQPAAQAVVGQSMGQRSRNALDLIRRSEDGVVVAQPKSKLVRTPLTPLAEAAQADTSTQWHRLYNLGDKRELLATVRLEDPDNPRDSPVTLALTTTLPNAVLHWGVKKAGRGGDWLKPPEHLLPAGSDLAQGSIAAETPFNSCTDGDCQVDWDRLDCEPSDFGEIPNPLHRITLQLPRGHGLAALTFVMRSEDGDTWWRDNGSNFTVPVPGSQAKQESAQGIQDELSRIIVDCEVKSGAWTLMHRFTKASELLGEVLQGRFSQQQSVEDSMVRIYTWLRYSAIRQLTWQRNYNTQPRILGSAQERLTHAIADAYSRTSGPAQEWARLMLTTVGRGGNAQAVRDEILNIMHRNKLPEKKGTFMEEWHQKLHNNTTPDDVPICEAYLAFLRSNGSLDTFWGVLSGEGITRKMLESYDRPIVTQPEFFADKRDSLIREFENYLKILKSVHSGADLQASASAASGHVPGGAKGYLGYVLANSNGHEILPIVEAAVEARTELQPVLRSSRDVLYLDLALENVVRAAAERGVGHAGPRATALVAPLLQNLALSLGDNEEVCYCLKAWQELPQSVRNGEGFGKDDALRAMAVIERVRRALASVSDHVSQTVGPVSQQYGEAFGCESWAVVLFPEEVVRGGPAFAVSLALSAAEPHLRRVAELGAWQIISPASCFGRLEVVPDLHSIQEKVYSEPTVLLVKSLSGEEEVPDGVVGVLSGDTCDVLAHLSVRSRNMHVLFASCYDASQLEELEGMEGKLVACEPTPAGVVNWREADDAEVAAHSGDGAASTAKRGRIKVSIPRWSGKWVVGMDAFQDGVVGAKSKNLAGLRGKLPDWINLPSSVTVPFGAFEEVLKRRENKALASELAKAVKAVQPGAGASAALERCRELVMQTPVPKDLQEALKQSMSDAGIPVPKGEEWEQALHSLKSVWASKYNDRAYVSTRKVGISFDDVRMAVLCQRVVPAQYAFVIHTTNPTNGDDGEIYCELVAGLGEAIVSGTVPGAALTFAVRKDDMDNPRVVLYPSKSEGLFVDESLIFRSDSNGEDLQGYAGAGLYDSVTTAATERRKVDYSSDRLLTDPDFRLRLMRDICATGLAIEKALGSAQDVEGVVDAEGKVTVVQTRPQM